VYPAGSAAPVVEGLVDRPLMVPMVRGGEFERDLPGLADARDLVASNLVSLPWEGLKLSNGDPAVPTRFVD